MRRPIQTLLLGALLLLIASSGLAQAPDESETARLTRRLDRIQERMLASGGLLPRYERQIHQLEETLQKGEYRHFHEWLLREIVQPWRLVSHEQILQLANNMPSHLTPAQRMKLRADYLRVQSINAKLRRARRLLTRLGRTDEQRVRSRDELVQLRGRYFRLLTELERVAPEQAGTYRVWVESTLAPQLEALQARDRFVAEGVRRLQHWTEDPSLRQMLQRIRRVSTALEQIRRQHQIQ